MNNYTEEFLIEVYKCARSKIAINIIIHAKDRIVIQKEVSESIIITDESTEGPALIVLRPNGQNT